MADHTSTHDAGHGGMGSYVVGFALSIALTAASFWLVMGGAVARGTALAGLLALCVAQLLVQLIFFLHMGLSREQRDNLSAFLFTLLIIAIIVGGSAWVLHNMNAHMMPDMPTMQQMREM
ncbi:cytochrome o ubiquinol oxidase subunit IV [Pigmentiphaga soli]|uniref:Cytochrome bo(3) ubiquinol oxidase subunit 4 n=1 Tax=Pigmentiphaga soli TaxID=1007095 RepID=A0ABP8GKH2_9BURK